MNTVIYPELGQTTSAEVEYMVSFSGKFYLITDIELSGRGILKTGDGSSHKRGKKSYIVTESALNKIKKSHTTCYIASL